jgi:DNA polymerase
MSETILWGDLETYCEIPITNGTHAYAEGVEVMLFAWAIGDEPVSVWDLTAGEPIPGRQGYRRPRYPALFPQFAL